jgi:hypothetical protein
MDFSEIYRQYARDVRRFTALQSGDPALAEELTAETFDHALCGPTTSARRLAVPYVAYNKHAGRCTKHVRPTIFW